MSLVTASWISDMAFAAGKAQHVFPQMAAAEAALESAFGRSALARDGNNLFGIKLHGHPILGPIRLPTKECLDNNWVVVSADWMKYGSVADCFADRMSTLSRLAPSYPNYAAALDAADAVTYVTEVSKKWSTDPDRAQKVIAIYNQYFPAAVEA